jgi:hypothetical protein
MDTVLLHKLGLQAETDSYSLYAPHDYNATMPVRAARVLHELPASYTWLHAFYTDQTQLEQEINTLAKRLTSSGQLWISWPKKSAGTVTDLSDTIVRNAGLKTGLVDIKVAAIDSTWSGLKFVHRKQGR